MAKKSINLRVGFDMKAFSTSSQNLTRSLQGTANKMKSIGKSMSMYVTAPLAGMAALSLKAFDEQAKALAQVEAGLKSTGNAVGYTSKQLERMAEDLQQNSLFGDEEILKGATAQLLTFTNIAGVQFERTQQAALDLATRLDGDLKSSSIMLGKALNDPVANLSALSRAGIQFSTDQKQTVKTLVETNRLAEAQTLILNELEKQYGGSAEAAARAGLGPLQQLQMAIGDLSEEFGKIIAEYLIPFADKMKVVIQRFKDTTPATKEIIVVVASLAAAIGPLIYVVGLLSGALAILAANPIMLTIGLLTAGFIALQIAANETNRIFGYVKVASEKMQAAYSNLGAEIEKINALKSRGSSATLEEIKLSILSTKATIKSTNALIKENLERKKALVAQKEAALQMAMDATRGVGKQGEFIDVEMAKVKGLEDNIAKLNSEIENLQNQGGRAVDGLIDLEEQIKTLGEPSAKQINKTTDALAEVGKQAEKVKINVGNIMGGDMLEDMAPKFKDIKPPKIEPIDLKVHLNRSSLSESAKGILDAIDETALEAKMKATKLGQDMGAALSSGLEALAVEGLTQFGEFLGDVISGGDMTVKDFGRGLLDSIGKFMGQFGEAMIAMGVAQAALGTAISLGPAGAPLAIAGGIALVAAGAAISNLSQKGVDMQGSNSTNTGGGNYDFGSQAGAMGYSNMMTTKISGRDLILVQEREKAFKR